jgi:hypothetical protein
MSTTPSSFAIFCMTSSSVPGSAREIEAFALLRFAEIRALNSSLRQMICAAARGRFAEYGRRRLDVLGGVVAGRRPG